MAEYIALARGSSYAHIQESCLLKAFFRIGYSIYSGNLLSNKNFESARKNLLPDDYDEPGMIEWQSANYLLKKIRINRKEYNQRANEFLNIVTSAKHIKDSNSRRNMVKKASTNYFVFMCSEIYDRFGVCIFDNVINAHLFPWLSIIDLDRFEKVYLYPVTRKILKDQFYEQLKIGEAHRRTNFLSAVKNHIRYLIRKSSSRVPFLNENLERKISILPAGTNLIFNRFTANYFWRLFILDLQHRYKIWASFDQFSTNMYVVKIIFEDFVADISEDRFRVWSNVKDTYDKNSIDYLDVAFDYRKSQINIYKFKQSKVVSTKVNTGSDEKNLLRLLKSLD